MKLYTTLYPFQTFTQHIPPKYLHPQSIYPPPPHLHSYQPTQKHIIHIAKTHLFLYSTHQLHPLAPNI
ncbi:metal ABC transporter solute-binding protein, Zn/Mn family, partial [Staphylococcus epidermidis]|uniref:metal ABC transporter solute-binding protein, Zn/Mn family n=1 Tax=Staphylococcus epidermidis TaxID=1282 RepID=UPI0037D9B46B